MTSSFEPLHDQVKGAALFVAYHHGDYVNVACAKCGSRPTLEYLGLDPAIPRFSFYCAMCGEQSVFKVDPEHFRGLPPR